MVAGFRTVSSQLRRSAFASNIGGMVICLGCRDGRLFGPDRRSFHAPMVFRHCKMNNLKGGERPFAGAARRPRKVAVTAGRVCSGNTPLSLANLGTASTMITHRPYFGPIFQTVTVNSDQISACKTTTILPPDMQAKTRTLPCARIVHLKDDLELGMHDHDLGHSN